MIFLTQGKEMKLKNVMIFLALVVSCEQVFSHALRLSQLSSVVEGSRERFHGLRDFRPVLDRVLYRGGGSGGQIQLRTNQLQALCTDGFSGAVYLYPTNFTGPQTLSCGNNSIHYVHSGFRAKPAEDTLRAIHQVIQSQSTAAPKGPVFVHCWNGWHASGEISAYALRQFCDMSGNDAAEYWADNVGDKGNLSKYGSIMNRIRNFQKISGLEITAEEKSRICPK